MPTQLEGKKLFDSIIAATGSENRRKMLVEIMDWMEKHGFSTDHIKVHKTSPDSEAGIPESASMEADKVAWEKTLVVALALGLIGREEVSQELLDKWENIIILDSSEKGLNLDQNVAVFGGDVVTLVGKDIDPDSHYEELLKLSRDLVGDEEQDRVTIEKDKEKIKDLYRNQDGFYVMYKVGIALLGNDEEGQTRGVTVAWDIFLKFNQLPEEMINDAYEEGGDAYSVGPRVDLASIYEDHRDEDFGIFVRQSDSPEDLWKPIEVEVMKGLVIGGLLPPHLCLQLFAEIDQTKPINQGKIEPRKPKIDISKKPMPERFRSYLDKVNIVNNEGRTTLVLPEINDAQETVVELEEDGSLGKIPERAVLLHLMRLVDDENNQALVHSLFDYIVQNKLPIKQES
ncbi:MAG: hypothetical protein OEX81_00680 [Candidatus Pacebacteria bacterium]|nr:hypothetical protein [Candidatus Paceibacterota bacterium]